MKQLRIIVPIALSIVAAAGAWALRQGPPEVAPSAEHAVLTKLAGTWDVTVDMYGDKSKAVFTSKKVGELWVAGEWNGDMMGAPFQGHMISGYSPEQKKFVGVWVDSMGAELNLIEGTYDAATKTLRQTITGSMKMSEVSVFRDDDHYTTKMSMVDAAGQETPMMTCEYTRRK